MIRGLIGWLFNMLRIRDEIRPLARTGSLPAPGTVTARQKIVYFAGASEIAFRCERLSIRMERLAQNFSRIGALSVEGVDAETVLALVRESKVFLELTAIDLDVERAFELVQIQRQLSRWHIHWQQTWTNDVSRLEISTLTQTWVARIQEMAGVLV